MSEKFSDAAMAQAIRLEGIATKIFVSKGFSPKEATVIVEAIVSATMCRVISARYAAGFTPGKECEHG